MWSQGRGLGRCFGWSVGRWSRGIRSFVDARTPMLRRDACGCFAHPPALTFCSAAEIHSCSSKLEGSTQGDFSISLCALFKRHFLCVRGLCDLLIWLESSPHEG